MELGNTMVLKIVPISSIRIPRPAHGLKGE